MSSGLPGSKLLAFENGPVRPGFRRIALASEGGESKLLFRQRNKKVVAARPHAEGYSSRVSFRFPPMRFLAVLELADVVAVKCPHDADTGEHRRPPLDERVANKFHGFSTGLSGVFA
jgi:hypothetical protein